MRSIDFKDVQHLELIKLDTTLGHIYFSSHSIVSVFSDKGVHMAQYQEHEVIMEESHCPPEYSLLVERTILSLIRSKQNNYYDT